MFCSPPCQRQGLGMALRTLLQNKAYLCVVGAYLCGPTAVVLVQSNLLMFCKYILGDASIIQRIIPCVQVSGLLCLPIWVRLGPPGASNFVTPPVVQPRDNGQHLFRNEARTKSGDAGRCSRELGTTLSLSKVEFGPTPAKIGVNPVQSGRRSKQLFSHISAVGPNSTTCWACLTGIGPESTNLAETRPSARTFGQCWLSFGRVWADLDRTWANADQRCLGMGQHRPPCCDVEASRTPSVATRGRGMTTTPERIWNSFA